MRKQNHRRKRSAARNVWQVIFQYPGYKAVITEPVVYKRVYFIARAISQLARHRTGLRYPGAKI